MSNIKLFLALLELRLSQSYNRQVYSLSRVPFLGRFVTDKFYGLLAFKQVLLGLSLLVSSLKSLFFSGLYFVTVFGIFMGLREQPTLIPSFLQGFARENITLSVQNALVLVNFLSVGFLSAYLISESDSDLYVGIRLFGISPRQYFLATESMSAFRKIILITLPLGTIIPQVSYGQSLAFALLVVGFRLFLRAFTLPLYRLDREKPTSLLTGLVVSGIALTIVLISFWIFKGNAPVGGFFSPWAAGLGIILIISSLLMLAFYPKLNLLTRRLLPHDSATSVSEVLAKANVEQVDIVTEEMITPSDAAVSDKLGLAYLTSLFLQRFKDKIRKMVRRRLIVIGVLAVLTNMVFYVTDWIEPDNIDQFWGLNTFAVYSGFLAYLGEFLMKLCFYQMDRPLLRYRFYRQKDFVLVLLKERFLLALRLNSPIFLATVVLFFSIYYYAFEWQWGQAFFLLFSLLLSLGFFSLYNLYLYFLFQPFTQGMTSKSTIYNIISWGFTLFSYQIIQIRTALGLQILLIAMGVFLVIGYLAIRFLAPKTFILK